MDERTLRRLLVIGASALVRQATRRELPAASPGASTDDARYPRALAGKGHLAANATASPTSHTAMGRAFFV